MPDDLSDLAEEIELRILREYDRPAYLLHVYESYHMGTLDAVDLPEVSDAEGRPLEALALAQIATDRLIGRPKIFADPDGERWVVRMNPVAQPTHKGFWRRRWTRLVTAWRSWVRKMPKAQVRRRDPRRDQPGRN